MASEANKDSGTSVKPATAEMMVERWLVMNAKVEMKPGSAYGPSGAGHMRMNITTSRRTLRLALANKADALRRL